MLNQDDYERRDIRMQQEKPEGKTEELFTVPAQDERFRNFIVKYNQNIHGEIDYVSNGTFQVINDYYAVLYVPEESVPEVEINSYSYNSIPKCYTYMDMESLSASGVTRLINHPYLKLRGRGTLVAVIDSGIDYTNEVFRDGSGSSKILALWDQSLPGGPSEQVPFGRAFTKKDIDAALRMEDPRELVPSADTNGHGTALAAAAAGSELPAADFSGAAPDASLVVIKLKPAKRYLREFYLLPREAEVFQEDDIMLALSFAVRCAQQYRMPLSVCIGLGTSQGAHAGASPLCQYINSVGSFTQNSVSVAAGNEGTARHHFAGNLRSASSVETVELRVGENSEGFVTEFWGQPPEQYRISIQSPTGESLNVSTSVRAAAQQLSFVFVETKVTVNYVLIERQTGNTLVFFRFLHPAPGVWKFRIQGGGGSYARFHMWLPVSGLIREDTYFLESTPYGTVTSPGDSAVCMTATACQYRDDSLYLQAGRGYLPDESVKPDFALPGVGIRTPLLKGGFGEATGTSLAAAQLSGIAALMFEWAVIRGNEPFFTGIGVKNYLRRGAVREDGQTYPDREWGYGRVNLYRTFELLT